MEVGQTGLRNQMRNVLNQMDPGWNQDQEHAPIQNLYMEAYVGKTKVASSMNLSPNAYQVSFDFQQQLLDRSNDFIHFIKLMDNLENMAIGQNVLNPVPNIEKDLVIILHLLLVERIALVKPFPIGFALEMIAKMVRKNCEL